MRPTAVCIGAGAISRALVAPALSAAGYRVVVVAQEEDRATALARAGRYTLYLSGESGTQRTVAVDGIDAIHLDDSDALQQAVVSADLMTMSVGLWGIDRVLPHLSRALEKRRTPIDLIVAENIPSAIDYVSAGLTKGGLAPDEARDKVNLVQTSVDRICPPAPASQEDPLALWAEDYSEFVVDAGGLGALPLDIPDVVRSFENDAYIHRKRLVFNLGHSAVAYFGFEADAGVLFMREAAELDGVAEKAILAMTQSATGIASKHPKTFTPSDMRDYVTLSFARIANRHIADTVSRVGRDVPRKLGRSERIVGSMRLAARYGHPFDAIARVASAALRFGGRPGIPEILLHELIEKHGMRAAFVHMSELSNSDPAQRQIVDASLQSPASFLSETP
jgi:mannitol-1-phosphate 5-dehydrogenase